MSKVITIHEYELKPDVDEVDFEDALRQAEEQGLFNLPGLIGHHFVRGIRGVRRGRYAAIWVYESEEAWARLWGPREQPIGKEDFHPNWTVWEEEILAPFLDRDPNSVSLNAYVELE